MSGHTNTFSASPIKAPSNENFGSDNDGESESQGQINECLEEASPCTTFSRKSNTLKIPVFD